MFAPDLKGFGENSDMPYPYCLDDYILSVREYMYKNSIVKPHVVAHSFGARIVIKSASCDGGLFDKIVLTGAAGLKPKPTLKKAIKRGVFKALKPFLGTERLSSFYSSDYRALSSVMQKSFIKIVNEHLDKYVHLIKNPTLLIFGENDRQTPPYMAKKILDEIDDCKLSFYKNAGHFCFLDCPLKFNLEVREFLLS